jgi:hypothetical protein
MGIADFPIFANRAVIPSATQAMFPAVVQGMSVGEQ